MNSQIKKTISFLLTILFIDLLVNIDCISQEKGHVRKAPDPKTILRIKNYGDFIVSGGNSGICTELLPSEYPSKFKCTIGYIWRKRKDINDNPNEIKRVPGISIIIIFYENEEVAKNELYKELFTLQEKGAVINNFKVNNNLLINIPPDRLQRQEVFWVSGTMKILLRIHDSAIPDELLNDYLVLHPPTSQINRSDINPSEGMKKRRINDFVTINNVEEMRTGGSGGPKKSDQYIAAMGQCSLEVTIRHQMGMFAHDEPISCPVALIMDNDKRKAEWKKLEEDVKTREVVLDNINWDNPDHCKVKYDMDAIADKIAALYQMSDSDFEKVPPEIRPSRIRPLMKMP